ncbi:MAG: HAMP domain-containing protein [Leptospira sp.]|nr:HAMP domain-containing protein [Leptospira sp.]
MDNKDFKPSRWTIRVKLIVIISSILIVALSSIIIIATYFFKQDNELRIKESNMKLTDIVALNLKSEFRSLRKSLTVTLQSIRITNEKKRFSDTLLKEEPSLIHAIVLDKDIKEVFSLSNSDLMVKYELTQSSVQNVISKYKNNFKTSFQGSTTVQNVSSGFKSPILAISFPYSIDNNSEIILIFVSLDKFLDSFQASGSVNLFLVNDQGSLLAHPDRKLVLAETNLSSNPIVDRMKKSPLDNGQFRYMGVGEDDVWYLGSFKKIGIAGLGVIATIREDKAFEEVYNIQRRNIYLMIAALNLAIIVIFIFSKKMSDPILNLVLASKKIEAGNYKLDLKPESRDEVGILTNSFQSMSQGLDERERLKVSFGKFVNEEIAELSMKGDLKVGGDRKNCAILFSDIRSFTSISEKLRPEEVVEFLNDYMSRMVNCVKSNNGYVDKFIGDAIMATWGALKPSNTRELDSVRAALKMRHALMEFNEGRGSSKKPKLKIGIGINYGSVISGQIGSDEKMEYTVIGDAVNLSSRLEGLTKQLGLDILVSDSVYESTKKEFDYEFVDSIKVKGKTKSVDVYAILGARSDKNTVKSTSELRSLIGYSKPDKS